MLYSFITVIVIIIVNNVITTTTIVMAAVVQGVQAGHEGVHAPVHP